MVEYGLLFNWYCVAPLNSNGQPLIPEAAKHASALQRGPAQLGDSEIFLESLVNSVNHAALPVAPHIDHNDQVTLGASAKNDAFGIYNCLELGVIGVPAKCCDLILGSMYALKASTSSARFPLFASLLLNAIRAGRRCFLITASAPEEFLARLDTCWEMSSNTLIAGRQLTVFSTQVEVTKKIFRYGADRFVQELSSFEVSKNAFVLYDQADDLLSMHDPFLARQQVEVLAKWFQLNQVTALLSFSKPSERQADTFNTLMDYFTGIAKLGGDRNGLELTFVYWQGSAGVAVARNFSLQTDNEGHYKAVETQNTQSPIGNYTRTASCAIDDRRSALDSEGFNTPSIWCYLYNDPGLDNLLIGVEGTPVRVSSVEEIIETIAQQERVMVLLNTGGIPDLRKTAQVVHTLRLNISNKVSVVVYGKQGDFLDNESQLLMRCGANAVLGMDTVQNSLGQTVNSLKRQIFLRPMDANFDNLWERYTKDIETQATPAMQFSAEAEAENISTHNLEINKSNNGYTYSKGRSAPPLDPRSNAKAKRSTFAA